MAKSKELKKAVWKFRPKGRGEVEVDPIQTEFFNTENVGGLHHALVRETIQNALDAKSRKTKGPVKVSFSKISLSRNDSKTASDFLSALDIHISSPESGLHDAPQPKSNLEALIIEDFGTKGLTGDTDSDEMAKISDSEENFYYFWRNVGRSAKGESDRGRWGLGKTVFPAVSRMNTFFGYTARETDKRILLMGQSVLKFHSVKGRRYNPYGYFGTFEGGESDDLALPVKDQETLDSFKAIFPIERKTEPGLSIVVLFPSDEITQEKIAISVISQYFFPILKGELIVSVNENGKKIALNAATLKDLINGLALDEAEKLRFQGLVEFAEWTIKLAQDRYITIPKQDLFQAPSWAESDLLNPEYFKEAKLIFETEKRIAFLVPIKVQKTGQEPKPSFFSVYLERNEELTKSEDYFIRGGITIAGISARRQGKTRAIVVIDDEPLTTFLGDAENPAHTNWEKDAQNFKGKYLHGPATISFVKNSPGNILKLLTEGGDNVDFNLLSDIFSIEQDKNEKSASDHGKSGKKKLPGPIDSSGNVISVSPVKGGFKLRLAKNAEVHEGLVNLSVAYDVRRGNPFSKYSLFDFDLSKPPIEIDSSEDVQLINVGSNGLQFNFDAEDFYLQVQGFDERRDVKLSIRWEQPDDKKT